MSVLPANDRQSCVSVLELKDSQAEMSGRLIDVRTPAEFREVHAEPARNVPLNQLDPKTEMSNQDADGPIYVICKSGKRGEQARQKFVAAGFTNVVNVEGGTDAWVAASLPVVRGRKTISLERQVRIVAGLLVFVFTLLGAFVDERFLIVPGFIGAGLTFAGVTDTCGMGMMLAKMPWNR